MCRTGNTRSMEQCDHFTMVLEGSDAVISPCIVKVLTVQVVLCNTYCSGGTYSNTLTLMCSSFDISCPFLKYCLCAKVHLVQIVK